MTAIQANTILISYNQTMQYFEPIENESVITESDDGQIILTNKRVRQLIDGQNLTSILLNKISSVQINRFHLPLLLMGGIVAVAFGYIQIQAGNSDTAQLVILIGILCVIAYFFTKKRVVTISSDGGAKIVFSTKGMSAEASYSFVNKLEDAKSKVI